jgi:L-ascorbate metabolism protein UlaG (beta-lactamase superfamily)
MRWKAKALSRGGLNHANDLQVGLLPTKGWSRRNFDFMGKVLLPSLLKRPGGEEQVADLLHPEAPESFKVTWIGHASFLIQTDGMNILVDPNWAQWLAIVKRVRRPGLRIQDLPRIDLVLVTHAHYDHLHLRTLRKVSAGQTIVVPKGVGKIVSKAGFGQIIEMNCWEEAQIDKIHITFTPSKHWGARNVHDVHRGFGGFLIRNTAGRTVFHCGDSAYFEGFIEIGKRASIDLALMPIGAYISPSGRSVHMNPEEAFEAFKDLGALHMAPMHYGTFPLGGEPMHEPIERFRSTAKERDLEHRVSVFDEGSPLIF